MSSDGAGVRRTCRRGAAIGASGLTGGLLAYPHNLYPALGAPVESLAALATPGLFAAAYLAWLGLLLLLTWTERKSVITWGDMARLTAFASVFLLYWSLATPLGRLWDEPYQLAHVRYLLETGGIADAPNNLAYFQFPGLALLGTAVALVADLNAYDVRPIVVTAMAAALVWIPAVALTRAVGSGRLGTIGSIVTAHAGLLLAAYIFFFPSTLALVWFEAVLFTVYLDGLRSASSRVVVILLFAATTVTHAVAPAVVLAGLVGAAIASRASGSRPPVRVPLLSLLAIFAAWLTYGASRFAHDVGQLVVNILARLLSGDVELFTLERSLAAQTSAALPLWALLVRWWWTLYLLLGVAAAALAVLAIPKARRAAGTEAGGILGTAAYSSAATVVSVGGVEFTRFALFAPLWTTLLWLRAATVVPRAVVVAVVGAWALSLPTWLSINAQVTSASVSPSEISPAAWSERVLGTSSNEPATVFFMSDGDTGPWIFHMPYTMVVAPSVGLYSSLEDYRGVVDEAIERFARTGVESGEPALFVQGAEAQRTAARVFGESANTAWNTMRSAAANAARGQVFDNGLVQILIGGGRNVGGGEPLVRGVALGRGGSASL